jgi:hypothetical protein
MGLNPLASYITGLNMMVRLTSGSTLDMFYLYDGFGGAMKPQ